MLTLRLRPAPRWISLLTLVSLLPSALADAQTPLPPQSLRFEPVAADGFYWFRDLEQDESGFLWIATEGGLSRYDGYEVRLYETDPNDPAALPHNFVTAVAPGVGGKLWVSLGAEMGWLDTASGAYHSASDDMGWGLVTDGAGALWGIHAASDAAPWGVRRWASPGSPEPSAPERMAPFGEEVDLDAVPDPPPRLVVDDDGHVWIPGQTLGLARAVIQADGSYAFVRWRPQELSARTVEDVRRGGDGTMWIRTDRGFHHWSEDEGFTLVVPTEQVPEAARTPTDFGIDRRGLLWLAPASENGVFALDPATGTHTHFRHSDSDPTSLPDARVTQIYEDRSGVLWFGTTLGLYKVTPRWDAFATYPLPASDITATLDIDRDGTLWVGSLCAPLFAFDPDAGTFASADEHLLGLEPPDCPMRLLQQRDGTYWIGSFPLDGSSQGLIRYVPETATTRVYPYASEPSPARPSSRRVRTLLEDRQGRVWIGGEEGLDRYDPATDTFTHHRHDPEDNATLASNTVWSLAEAPDGSLWVGAGGLNRLDPETGLVTRFLSNPSDPTGLPSEAISWIHLSQHEPGTLWLATYDGGLVRFDPASRRATRYTRSEGLPANYVKAILEDARGRIWAPTQEGLARLDPATGEVQSFTEADGLHSRTFGLYDAATLPDGRFVLAHSDAVVVFHPDSIGTNPRTAPVALTSFRVFDREAPTNTGTVRLDHDDSFFSFEFAALDFAAPEQTRYAYRLDGFDDGWVESGTRRYAAYTNLSPGRYTFRARANTGGGWSEDELVVPVVIAPAWWQTAAFRLFAALTALGGLVATVRFASTRRLKRRLRRLEVQQKLQAERERISQDLHDHVGAQLSTIISGIDLARLAANGSSGGDGASAEDPLTRVEASARQTMSQLRETIWAIHHESVGLGAFHERLCAYAREQSAFGARGPEICCTLEASESSTETTLSPAQTLHLYRIAQEAIQNALKHASAERIDVLLRATDDTLFLSIADDGQFDAETPAADGLSGYGLAGMQRRADALGARFVLDTSRGTSVQITAPLHPEPPGSDTA